MRSGIIVKEFSFMAEFTVRNIMELSKREVLALDEGY